MPASPRLIALPALATLLLAIAAAPAAPPTTTAITPRGFQRGQTVEVVITGTNLGPQTRLLLPFKAEQKFVPDAKPVPTQARIQLTVDAAVPVGIYPVRVATDDGISAMQFISVEAFPGVNEVKPNATADKAQKVPFPVVINGTCTGGEVGFYRFPATKGQRVVVETISTRLGSGLLPQVRVTDAKGRFVAADDTQALQGDARVRFVAAEDGEFIVEISDSRYRAAAPPHYRLVIADYDTFEEIFPLGGKRGGPTAFTLRGGTLPNEVKIERALDDSLTPGSALLMLDGVGRPGMLAPQVAVGELPERTWLNTGTTPLDIQPPLVVNGRLAQRGAADRFQLPVQPNQRYRITVQAEALGSYLDGVLRISDQAGKQLALVDDVDVPPTGPGQPATKAADPSTEFTVPAGVTALVLELTDQRKRGGVNFGYRLTVEPATADFLLRPSAGEINVPRGGAAAILVPVVRRGYTGPVQLEIANVPPWLTVQGGAVPANGTQGLLTLSAAADAPAQGEPLQLRVTGKVSVDGQEIVRRAVQQVIVSREGNPAQSLLSFDTLAVGLTATEPFTLQGPPTLEVVKGYPATVPVTIKRSANPPTVVEIIGSLGAAAPQGQPPASTLTFAPASAAPGVGNVNVTLTPGLAGPEGTLQFVVQGKAKVDKADVAVVSPAIALTVHRPFTIETPAPLAIAAGETIILKGKLARRDVCKEAVTLKLDGLPAGVTLAAPPKPLPADAGEFQIELKAGPRLTPATVTLNLTGSATIAGMAYTHPPVPVMLQVK